MTDRPLRLVADGGELIPRDECGPADLFDAAPYRDTRPGELAELAATIADAARELSRAAAKRESPGLRLALAKELQTAVHLLIFEASR